MLDQLTVLAIEIMHISPKMVLERNVKISCPEKLTGEP
jgi:hypothetical protein